MFFSEKNDAVNYVKNMSDPDRNLVPIKCGWTREQLAHGLNLAKQLRETSREWADDRNRCVQFCKEFDDLMNRYQLLHKEKAMHRWQLPITAFSQPLKRPTE